MGLQYIFAIESHGDRTHYHLHTIFIFNNKPNYEKEWWEKIWSNGYVHNEPFIENHEHGLLFYLTRYKKENIQKDDPSLTKFPH